MIQLMEHQKKALELTRGHNKVAYYHDMGLGKTYTGTAKAIELGDNILIVCQKSKIEDWTEHLLNYFDRDDISVCEYNIDCKVHIINYDLIWRRSEFNDMSGFTMILDESSLIKNKGAKRTKFITGLNYKNLILLSGTICGGKYEDLITQINMLGWDISEAEFWRRYIKYRVINVGFPMKQCIGYKNVDELKAKLREHGAVFLMTDEVLDLPDQTDIIVKVDKSKDYDTFVDDSYIVLDKKSLGGAELVGDTALTQLLYQRMLASSYSLDKKRALQDIVDSTNEKMVIFYQFDQDLVMIKSVIGKRSFSVVNGKYKDTSGDIIAVQYQAGAMGLNLQDRNIIVYYTLPLSSDLYSQSRKRIHRIGQKDSCFYYHLITKGSVESKIYDTLLKRQDYTVELFRE